MDKRNYNKENKENIIYDYMVEYCLTNNIPPSIREIQDACSISSTCVVVYNINKLIQDGRVERVAKKFSSRGYVPTLLQYERM